MRKPWPNLDSRESVTVFGMGRSGRSAARLLRARGCAVRVVDSQDTPSLRTLAEELESEGIATKLGAEAGAAALDGAWAVLSPGIDPAVDLVRDFSSTGRPILSEIELAWRASSGNVVAITGTNGKTTTTELTQHLLAGLGVTAVACGNIGLTFSEALLAQPQTEVFVVEVSSFQLEACSLFAPEVAVWTNFSANHLDRYRDEEEYFLAKARIFAAQTATNWAVVQAGSRWPEIAARKLTFSAQGEAADFTLRDGWICRGEERWVEQAGTQLPGPHNAENLMAAGGVLTALGYSLPAAAAHVADYTPPAHRCEPVAEINGVLFVNDSKSTNLDALARAVQGQNRPLVLIAGGKDKGFDYAPLADLAREKVRHAVLIGQMRERIARDWSGVPCTLADSLPHAVELARQVVPPGGVVLLSPGTSSFDMFRSYEERGEVFKEAVRTRQTSIQSVS
jgi:UDP-N-acetylmuramoylalanine--D-glutamate ligase